MQAFKIDNFLRDHPGALPPRFETLTDSEASELSQTLLLKTGRPTAQPADVIRWFAERATPLGDIDLEKNQIALLELVERAEIMPGPALYVQWGLLRDIDRFQSDDLSAYFYDVWYPSADDIEVFDDTLAWMMFIRHYGGVEIWRSTQVNVK
jgi:hypothetical protein